MRTAFGILFGALCLLVSVSQTRAGVCDSNPLNLVKNCGFESGDFTGWNVSGNDVPGELGNLYGVEGQDPFDSISPTSGNDQAFFADIVGNATTISQTFTTFVGGVYGISFYLAQDTAPGVGQGNTAYNNAILASFGGVALLNQTNVPVENYTLYSYNVTATSTSSTLSLKLDNSLGEFLLDDVVVTPEPSAWILMLVVAAGGVFLLKRKAQQGLVRTR